MCFCTKTNVKVSVFSYFVTNVISDCPNDSVLPKCTFISEKCVSVCQLVCFVILNKCSIIQKNPCFSQTRKWAHAVGGFNEVAFSFPLMNSFNKTKAAIFRMQTASLGLFLSHIYLVKLKKNEP